MTGVKEKTNHCVLNIATDNEKAIKKVRVGYLIKSLIYLFENNLYFDIESQTHQIVFTQFFST